MSPNFFDITDEKQIPEVVDKAQKELGLVDILVNNAGYRCPKGAQDEQ